MTSSWHESVACRAAANPERSARGRPTPGWRFGAKPRHRMNCSAVRSVFCWPKLRVSGDIAGALASGFKAFWRSSLWACCFLNWLMASSRTSFKVNMTLRVISTWLQRASEQSSSQKEVNFISLCWRSIFSCPSNQFCARCTLAANCCSNTPPELPCPAEAAKKSYEYSVQNKNSQSLAQKISLFVHNLYFSYLGANSTNPAHFFQPGMIECQWVTMIMSVKFHPFWWLCWEWPHTTQSPK